jgi:DNA replication and repair protein RecF
MSLRDLVVENVRSIRRAELTLHARRNLIWGPNGSGKTSLLEAMFLLGRGRSFRTRNSERLIQQGQSQLLAFGRLDTSPERAIGVQISKSDATVAKLDGQFVRSLTELSQAFAVQVIDPGIHRLVEEGGNRRRKWIDWLVFHVEPGFIENWTAYTRALKQRNAALRHQPEQVPFWDAELLRFGLQLDSVRRSVVGRLEPYWSNLVPRLVGLDLELTYAQGWPQDLTFADALAQSADRDRLKGVTHAGPHRADIRLRQSGRMARDTLSRGQQKLAAIAMTLAPLRLIQDTTGIAPTLLLDDPEAELDAQRLSGFIREVEQLNCQLVFTALHQTALFGTPESVFHVEHGAVQAGIMSHLKTE